jgi:hypothetical protein
MVSGLVRAVGCTTSPLRAATSLSARTVGVADAGTMSVPSPSCMSYLTVNGVLSSASAVSGDVVHVQVAAYLSACPRRASDPCQQSDRSLVADSETVVHELLLPGQVMVSTPRATCVPMVR